MQDHWVKWKSLQARHICGIGRCAIGLLVWELYWAGQGQQVNKVLPANAKRNSITSDLAIFHVFVTVCAFQNCLAPWFLLLLYGLPSSRTNCFYICQAPYYITQSEIRLQFLFDLIRSFWWGLQSVLGAGEKWFLDVRLYWNNTEIHLSLLENWENVSE